MSGTQPQCTGTIGSFMLTEKPESQTSRPISGKHMWECGSNNVKPVCFKENPKIWKCVWHFLVLFHI